MSSQKIYIFDDPEKFVFDDQKVEISAGAARLKMDEALVAHSQDFASSTGFTFNSSLAEFVGGLLRQKDQRPANNTFWASFASSINANWGGGVLTGTNNGATHNAGTGRIEMLGAASTKYVDWVGTGNGDSLQVGCARVKVIPNYSGTPGTHQHFLRISQANANTNNIVGFFHNTSGAVALRIFSSTGVAIISVDLAAWSPVAGTAYEFELNWDITTGATRLFINGTQLGATQGATGTRSGAVALIRSGESQTLASSFANFSITSIQLFSTVQHTANYTPGADPSETIYLESSATLPEMPKAAPGVFLSLASFASSESNAPHYTAQLGQSGTYLYWNGSAWVASDGTYAQANTAAAFNANAGSLPIEDELYVQMRVHFQSSNTLQSVDSLSLSILESIGFSTTAQRIKAVDRFAAGELTAFSESVETPDDTGVRYILEVESEELHWSGSAFTPSNGTYAQANTAEELHDQILKAIDRESYVRVIALLKTEDSAETPEISSAEFSYDEDPQGERGFLNTVLDFIGQPSLTDEEFESIVLEDADWNVETYTALLAILEGRESVSGATQRLEDLFSARGVEVSAPSTEGKSNILIGGAL